MVTLSPTELLYEGVANKIAALILGGTLRPGDKIPSVRKTCAQQKVSVSTVLQAYVELENRGLIEAKPKSGFFVRYRLDELAGTRRNLWRHVGRRRRIGRRDDGRFRRGQFRAGHGLALQRAIVAGLRQRGTSCQRNCQRRDTDRKKTSHAKDHPGQVSLRDWRERVASP